MTSHCDNENCQSGEERNVQIGCGHNFCLTCLSKQLLSRKFFCTTCKADIAEQDLAGKFPYFASDQSACFICDENNLTTECFWCFNCMTLMCSSCFTLKNVGTISNANEHAIEHLAKPLTTDLLVKLSLQIAKLQHRKYDTASVEEVQRIRRFAEITKQKLHPVLSSHVNSLINQQYFGNAIDTFQKQTLSGLKGKAQNLLINQHLLQIFFGPESKETSLGNFKSGVKYTVSELPPLDYWSRIMQSGDKMNSLIMSTLSFGDSGRSLFEALKEICWILQPEYFDSSHWDRIDHLSDPMFNCLAEVFGSMTNVNLPAYNRLVYDSNLPMVLGLSDSLIRLANNFAQNTKAIEKEQSGGFCSSFLCCSKGRGNNEVNVSFTVSNGVRFVGENDDFNETDSLSGVDDEEEEEVLIRGPDNDDDEGSLEPTNEEGEALEFRMNPIDFSHKNFCICEPSILPDGRILVCCLSGGVFIFDDELHFIGLERPSRRYQDLKIWPDNEILIGIVAVRAEEESDEEKRSELDILDFNFAPLNIFKLPEPSMDFCRCLCPVETGLYLLETSAIFFVPWKIILQPASAKRQGTFQRKQSIKEDKKPKKIGLKTRNTVAPLKKPTESKRSLKEKDFKILYSQRAKDVCLATFLAHNNALYISSRDQNEILVMDGESAKILKRLRSEKFKVPSQPGAICKDEFGNLLVCDEDGVQIFNIETGAYRGCAINLDPVSGEITAKNGFIYVALHKGILMKVKYCEPDGTVAPVEESKFEYEK